MEREKKRSDIKLHFFSQLKLFFCKKKGRGVCRFIIFPNLQLWTRLVVVVVSIWLLLPPRPFSFWSRHLAWPGTKRTKRTNLPIIAWFLFYFLRKPLQRNAAFRVSLNMLLNLKLCWISSYPPHRSGGGATAPSDPSSPLHFAESSLPPLLSHFSICKKTKRKENLPDHAKTFFPCWKVMNGQVGFLQKKRVFQPFQGRSEEKPGCPINCEFLQAQKMPFSLEMAQKMCTLLPPPRGWKQIKGFFDSGGGMLFDGNKISDSERKGFFEKRTKNLSFTVDYNSISIFIMVQRYKKYTY